MLNGLLGPTSAVAMLKEGLSAASERARAIASRVANAANGTGGFAGVMERAQAGDAVAGGEPVDIEKEMVSLADEQMRYDAASRLLQKVYAQIRESVQEH